MLRKADIFRSNNLCMTPAELFRLRTAAGLSQDELAAKLNSWGWYRGKVNKYETGKVIDEILRSKQADGKVVDVKCFSFSPQEMTALLNALDASSIGTKK